MANNHTRDLSLREKVVSWFIDRVVSLANSDIDVAEMQAEHDAYEARIIKMRVDDLGKEYHFRVREGNLEFLQDVDEADGGFAITSEALIALAKGHRTMMNPATGEQFKKEYGPVDALTQGELTFWGEAATNDALLFARAIYDKVQGDIRAKLGEVKEVA